MSSQLKKLFLLFVAIGMLFTATTFTAPADAAAPPSQRASISVDKLCTVTGTFTWKNVDQDTFAYASVNLYKTTDSNPTPQQVANAYDGLRMTGDLKVSAPGEFGAHYLVIGTVYYIDGGYAPLSTSRTLTTRCP